MTELIKLRLVRHNRKISLFDQAVACHGLGFECSRTAAISQLDFATQVAYVLINKLNPGPSGEDTEVSANLAMSDHVPRRMDLPTSGPKVLSISLIFWPIRGPFGANERQVPQGGL